MLPKLLPENQKKKKGGGGGRRKNKIKLRNRLYTCTSTTLTNCYGWFMGLWVHECVTELDGSTSDASIDELNDASPSDVSRATSFCISGCVRTSVHCVRLCARLSVQLSDASESVHASEQKTWSSAFCSFNLRISSVIVRSRSSHSC